MVKKQQKQRRKPLTEADSAYVLKLVLYVVLASLWLKFAHPVHIGMFVLNGLPLGLILGIIFASHDHFQIDRKIEYAILIVMTIISYFLPSGIIL